MTHMPGVLVVSPDAKERVALAEALEGLAWLRSVPTIWGARRAIGDGHFEVVLCAHQLPDGDGVSFLRNLSHNDPGTVGVLLCPSAEAEGLLEGSGNGGVDLLVPQPWGRESLRVNVRSALRLAQGRRPVPQGTSGTLDRIVHCRESSLREICQQIRRLARHDVGVLITGETGTGKELFARALHTHSPRSGRPFLAESCAALSETLLESELFGHRKGSFTGAHESRTGLFEQSHGGTLFLDEIGEISSAFQTKLLRVLQEGEFRPLGEAGTRQVDCRVVTATNRDLEEEVRSGRFREDLFYRLATVEVNIPPLRERPEDIPVLAGVILEEAAAAFGLPVPDLPEETIGLLQAYPWPGNVRELQNEIQRMVVMADGEALAGSHFSPRVRRAVIGEDDVPEEEGSGQTLQGQLDRMEIRILRAALARHGGNKTRTAEELGLSRVGLRSKLERHGLHGERSEVAG